MWSPPCCAWETGFFSPRAREVSARGRQAGSPRCPGVAARAVAMLVGVGGCQRERQSWRGDGRRGEGGQKVRGGCALSTGFTTLVPCIWHLPSVPAALAAAESAALQLAADRPKLSQLRSVLRSSIKLDRCGKLRARGRLLPVLLKRSVLIDREMVPPAPQPQP